MNVIFNVDFVWRSLYPWWNNDRVGYAYNQVWFWLHWTSSLPPIKLNPTIWVFPPSLDYIIHPPCCISVFTVNYLHASKGFKCTQELRLLVHFKRTWAEPNFGIILVDIMDYYNLHLTSRVASYQCFNENVGSFNWGKCSQMQMHAFEREREREISQPPWII